MRNLKITMAYNGTRYHGYQSQNNALAIQDVVEKAMSRLLKQEISINGCSRTDAGVHARAFVFSVKVDSRIPCDGLVRGMNTILPDDIAFLSCEEAAEDFHARFCSKGKEYVYIVNNSGNRDVFGKDLSLRYNRPLDAAALNEAAKLFIGTHDFGAFCKAEAKEHLATTVRTIFGFSIVRKGENVEFYISGDGFLHNMVRILVGTLIYVSEGKRTEDDVRAALETGKRDFAGITLPPCGLYLNKVFY